MYKEASPRLQVAGLQDNKLFKPQIALWERSASLEKMLFHTEELACLRGKVQCHNKTIRLTKRNSICLVSTQVTAEHQT